MSLPAPQAVEPEPEPAPAPKTPPFRATVARDPLASGVAWLKRVAGLNPQGARTLPVLRELLLTTPTPTELRLAATDLTTAASVTCAAEIHTALRDGLLVNAKALHGFLGKGGPAASAQPLTLTQLGARRLSVEGLGYTELEGAGVPDDYPELPVDTLPREAKDDWLTLPVDVWARYLAALLPALSVDGTRLSLGGVFVHNAHGTRTWVACDGHRLHRIQEPVAGPARPVLYPGDAARLLLALATTLSAQTKQGTRTRPPLTLHAADRHGDYRARVAVQGPLFAATMTTRLADEKGYPDYAQVWPKAPPPIGVILPAKTMLNALSRLALHLTEKRVGARITIPTRQDDAVLQLEVCDGEKAVARERVRVTFPADTDAREQPVVFGMNPAYIREAIAAVGTPHVLLRVGPLEDGREMVTPVTFEDPDGRVNHPTVSALVMPMRV